MSYLERSLFVMITLPQDFITKMKLLLKNEVDEFFACYEKERTAGLRINPLKITEQQWQRLAPFPLEKIPFVKYGYYYHYDQVEPGKHPYHLAGLYYIQEPSAGFVAEVLDVKPGDLVLDLCAAPGGKSTQIGALLNGDGILVANEIVSKRAKVLSENIERMGIKNAIVTNETPEKLAKHFPHYFTKIVVDAPCSGEGMFRKDPESIQFWSTDHVKQMSEIQYKILQNAYQMLKSGGILVYSTCTFSPEENEQVVERFLNDFPDMELVEIEKIAGISDGRPEWSVKQTKDLKKCARIWPHLIKGEGHFIAKMKKTSVTIDKKPIKKAKTKLPVKELQYFFDFQKNYLVDVDFPNITKFGNQLYSLPPNCPDLTNLKILRAGLHLGELKKNRFEPNHALALYLKKENVKQTVNLSSTEKIWQQYVKGETIKGCGQNGWVLVTIDGFSLGWGKEIDGIVKNFYPKGLRLPL